MNILPKKSWHVLSKDNIQRVRQDEAAAKAKEEEKQHRAQLAEREAQLNLMRKRARERDGIDVSQTDVSQGSDGHINFFSDIQQGTGIQILNKDHEQEKKSEQETFEKRVGILNYLVDKQKSDDPWYVTERREEESSKSKHRKEIIDPVNDMNRYLAVKKKCVEPSKVPVTKIGTASVKQTSSKLETSSHSKPSHKKKHKHQHKERDDKLEKLRRERQSREEAEKIKSDALLKKHYGIAEETTYGNKEPSRKYNSQYNPSLARY